MEQFQIETAQNISIDQNTAHLGDRMLAYIIDSLIIVMYYIIVIWFLLAMDVEPKDQWAIYLLFSLPAFMYYFLLETFMDGKTIGKYFMKTRVVMLDGSKPGFAQFFIRWIMRIVDITLSSGGVAVLTLLARGKGQRLGDIAAGTTVISEKKRFYISDSLLQNLPVDYQPRFPQVTIFKDAEMRTIKNVYVNARKNGNHKVIVSLSDRIKKIAEITTDLKPMEFVDYIIKDYSYFTQQ